MRKELMHVLFKNADKSPCHEIRLTAYHNLSAFVLSIFKQ